MIKNTETISFDFSAAPMSSAAEEDARRAQAEAYQSIHEEMVKSYAREIKIRLERNARLYDAMEDLLGLMDVTDNMIMTLDKDELKRKIWKEIT
ncbi:MAG: hypothetical protein IKI75_06320 [Lachnospiraceae bacterium]|nr:hypothetical protein [Lachnospiraceae bacterium]